MTRRYTRLIAVAILIAAFGASISAQLLLGINYSTGQGVPQDYAEAMRWYRLAADQGHPGGQFLLAANYLL